MNKVGLMAAAVLVAHSIGACSRPEPSLYPIAICPGSGLRATSTFNRTNGARRGLLPTTGEVSSGESATASTAATYLAEYHSGDVGAVLGFAIETAKSGHRLIVRVSSRGADRYGATWTWERTVALSSGDFAQLSALFEAPSLWNEPIDARVYGAGSAHLSWTSQGKPVQQRDLNGSTTASRTLREALIDHSRCR